MNAHGPYIGQIGIVPFDCEVSESLQNALVFHAGCVLE